ncbi:MAG: hypothetical protein KBC83_01555 [Candidatus Moranbacteria bacterium]|nr:hypothetical protein [Candidatus Moranbacteria bacterium]
MREFRFFYFQSPVAVLVKQVDVKLPTSSSSEKKRLFLRRVFLAEKILAEEGRRRLVLTYLLLVPTKKSLGRADVPCCMDGCNRKDYPN